MSIFISNNLIAATVNCNAGECEFYNSNHYKYAKTYCSQLLYYEDVETNFTNFIITKTGKECQIFDTSD